MMMTKKEAINDFVIVAVVMKSLKKKGVDTSYERGFLDALIMVYKLKPEDVPEQVRDCFVVDVPSKCEGCE